MATCPNGHATTATDYCDTCGAPVVNDAADPAVAAEKLSAGEPAALDLGGSQPAPSDAASVNASSKPCPHCHGLNPVGALFCEACGYDFTTGSLPRPSESAPQGSRRPQSDADAAPANPLDLDAPAVPAPAPAARAEAAEESQADEPDAAGQPETGSGPDQAPEPIPSATEQAEPSEIESSEQTLPNESDAATPVPAPATGAPANDSFAESAPLQPEPAEAPAPLPEADDVLLAPSASGGDAPSEEPTVVQPSVPAAVDEPAQAGEAKQVAELWIDPDWYAGQDSPDQLPSPGLPRVVPLRGSSWLIGRPSKSRGIEPDLDCEPDTGVSRKHAQISFDGSRWWVEDLGSSNGTYVGDAGAPLPSTPIKARTELGTDARVYVGSWTRIVIRPAEPGEFD